MPCPTLRRERPTRRWGRRRMRRWQRLLVGVAVLLTVVVPAARADVDGGPHGVRQRNGRPRSAARTIAPRPGVSGRSAAARPAERARQGRLLVQPPLGRRQPPRRRRHADDLVRHVRLPGGAAAARRGVRRGGRARRARPVQARADAHADRAAVGGPGRRAQRPRGDPRERGVGPARGAGRSLRVDLRRAHRLPPPAAG